MMAASGIPSADARRHLPAIMAKAQSLYVRRCPDLRARVCPGVRSTLQRLHRHGAVTGLVTGNLSRIAWRKMQRAGLDGRFRFGAFAEQGRTRAQLIRTAVREARSQGWIARGALITMVGDHPNDILAARAAGVRSLAVGTGVVPMDELALHRPDLLVPDLRALDPAWLRS
jgi:phosphoglycolate phosphatase-like HAD superfamily hydrolase